MSFYSWRKWFLFYFWFYNALPWWISIVFGNCYLYELAFHAFDIKLTAINFSSVLPARHSDIVLSFGNNIVYEASSNIFVIYIKLYVLLVAQQTDWRRAFAWCQAAYSQTRRNKKFEHIINKYNIYKTYYIPQISKGRNINPYELLLISPVQRDVDGVCINTDINDIESFFKVLCM